MALIWANILTYIQNKHTYIRTYKYIYKQTYEHSTLKIHFVHVYVCEREQDEVEEEMFQISSVTRRGRNISNFERYKKKKMMSCNLACIRVFDRELEEEKFQFSWGTSRRRRRRRRRRQCLRSLFVYSLYTTRT